MLASRLQNAYLALQCKIDPRRKNYISGYIWHRSFIQTAKSSLLDEEIMYQSSYGAPLMFSYFLLQEKVLCFGTHRRDLHDDYWRRPCRKNYISSYIWHKLFIQMVKQLASSYILMRHKRIYCIHVCAYMRIRILGWRVLRVYFGSDISELHCTCTNWTKALKCYIY